MKGKEKGVCSLLITAIVFGGMNISTMPNVMAKEVEAISTYEQSVEKNKETITDDNQEFIGLKDDEKTVSNWNDMVKKIEISKGEDTILVNDNVIKYVKQLTDVKDITGTKQGDILAVDMQLKNVYLESKYLNGVSQPGISFYNMINFYVNVLQVNQLMTDNSVTIVKDNKGNECDTEYVRDMLKLLEKIMKFDHSLSLSYDEKSENGTDVIATEGSATLKFHIDSHGWWGYELGAKDNITAMIMNPDIGDEYWTSPKKWGDEKLSKIQKEYAEKYTQFFKIKMPYSNEKSTCYMLNATDLENPMIYVSADGKEALMIDVDMYGFETLNKAIKDTIGDKCERLKIFITHNHPDHVNNLDIIAKDPTLKSKVEIIWPENEPYSSVNPETIFGADKVVKVSDNEEFVAAGTKFKFVEIPNQHTPAGGQLIDLDNHINYVGDTLGAQVHLGGTNVSMSDIDAWIAGAQRTIDEAKNGQVKWLIGGHTPYLNSVDFAKWLKTACEYAKEQFKDDVTWKGGLVVVQNGQITTDSFKNGLTDAQEKYIASVTFRNDSSYSQAIKEVTFPQYDENGNETRIPVSKYLQKHLDTSDLSVNIDSVKKTITVKDVQLKNVNLSSNYLNGKSAAGESFYNMINYFTDVKQIRNHLKNGKEDFIVVDSKGNQVNKEYIEELHGLLQQINDFDPSTNLQYDWDSVYDTDAFKEDETRGGTDVIATSHQGHVSLRFHIDSHGWWGYDLGAHDSITGLVMGLSDEEAKEKQHEYTMKYGNFFVIKMNKSLDNQGQWYMLNGTDLENPLIYVSADGKEALMVDVDFYGNNVIVDKIKSVIGNKCEDLKIFLTHNHGDHVNNLAVIAQDEELRKKTTIIWPENEPHTILNNVKDLPVLNMKDKDIISDVQWKDVQKVKDGEILKIAGYTFKVNEILNEHTPGGVQLADLTNKVIYCGDTLGAQIHLGGTTVKLSNLNNWIKAMEKSEQFAKDNEMKYYIGGHTPYLNTIDFASWNKVAMQYAEKQLKMNPKWKGLVIVENGKVVTEDRMKDIFMNGLSDREELSVASVNFINDIKDNPSIDVENSDKDNNTSTTKPSTNETVQANETQTDDTSSIVIFVTMAGLSVVLAAAILKKKKEEL